MSSPTFSVVAMVRETADVIELFARHHLQLGAETVRLFFDGEQDEAPGIIIPGLSITVCDSLFWVDRLGRMPSNLDEGLRTVFREAHETSTSDWQFFCDADEFLVSSYRFADLLTKIPTEVESLRIMNLEAVWGPDDLAGDPFGCTYFRVPLKPKNEAILRILLPRRRHKQFRKGLVGHCFGKHMLRKGTIVDSYNSHSSSRNGFEVGVWSSDLGFNQDHVFVAHFDAISEARWIEKWRRRLSKERPSTEMGPHRRAQAEAISEANSNGTMPLVFRELYTTSSYETTILGAIGGIRRHRIFVAENSSEPDPGGSTPALKQD